MCSVEIGFPGILGGLGVHMLSISTTEETWHSTNSFLHFLCSDEEKTDAAADLLECFKVVKTITIYQHAASSLFPQATGAGVYMMSYAVRP